MRKSRYRWIILPFAGLLASCSSMFDELLFKLVPRPQEPSERLYNIVQVKFINPWHGTELSGELTYPAEGK